MINDGTTDTTQTTVTGYSNNLYRKFRVTGHVTNQFNTEFAKLDAFPSAGKLAPIRAVLLMPPNSIGRSSRL